MADCFFLVEVPYVDADAYAACKRTAYAVQMSYGIAWGNGTGCVNQGREG